MRPSGRSLRLPGFSRQARFAGRCGWREFRHVASGADPSPGFAIAVICSCAWFRSEVEQITFGPGPKFTSAEPVTVERSTTELEWRSYGSG